MFAISFRCSISLNPDRIEIGRSAQFFGKKSGYGHVVNARGGIGRIPDAATRSPPTAPGLQNLANLLPGAPVAKKVRVPRTPGIAAPAVRPRLVVGDP